MSTIFGINKNTMIKDLEIVNLDFILDIAEWLYDGDDMVLVED